MTDGFDWDSASYCLSNTPEGLELVAEDGESHTVHLGVEVSRDVIEALIEENSSAITEMLFDMVSEYEYAEEEEE